MREASSSRLACIMRSLSIRRRLSWKSLVLHPVLFAAFPILFLYAHNIHQTSASQMWLPLGVSVAATVVLWAALSLILRSVVKAALATTILVFFFFNYGRFYELIEHQGVWVPRHAYLLPSVLFFWGYCTYFIKLVRRDFALTTRILNVAAVALIAVNLLNIGSYQIRLARVEAVAPAETPEHTIGPADISTLPDIYFIILDNYAHPDTMLEWYDYDNSEFINSLEDKGFFVAHGSRTRTPSSPQCIAQVLSMEYLTPGWYFDADIRNYVEHESGVTYHESYTWNDITFRKITYSRVADLLRAQGYRYIAFGNDVSNARWDNYMEDNTDLYFNYFVEAATSWVSEFQETLWNTTMLRPFYYELVGSHYETALRRMTLGTIQHLKVIPEVEGPKFVFAYVNCPHTPFVFGPQGEYVDPINWQNRDDKQFYLGQYIFISREIENVVDVLLTQSEVPPVIVLQSDHGLRRGYPVGGSEWKKILNAMYLPGMDYDELSESISPVNTFRLIFNHYFGAEYPLLEDD